MFLTILIFFLRDIIIKKLTIIRVHLGGRDMERYGIIGGTFDPIHYAHLYIAYEAREQLQLDKIIFMPAGKQPLKVDNKVTDPELRYEMVKLAIEDYDEFSISDYEIEKQGLSYTYLTLEHFNRDDRQLFFITGADCLMNIEKWREVDKIFSICTFVVFLRGGFDREKLRAKKEEVERKYNANIVILELKELEISSTDIRDRIRNNKRVDFFIPEKVKNFIEVNGLYKED